MAKTPDRKFVLLQDIVIPRGTVFTARSGHVQLLNSNYETIIGVTKDSMGQVLYGIDDSDPELKNHFLEIVQ
jgi:hypothetical protein